VAFGPTERYALVRLAHERRDAALLVTLVGEYGARANGVFPLLTAVLPADDAAADAAATAADASPADDPVDAVLRLVPEPMYAAAIAGPPPAQPASPAQRALVVRALRRTRDAAVRLALARVLAPLTRDDALGGVLARLIGHKERESARALVAVAGGARLVDTAAVVAIVRDNDAPLLKAIYEDRAGRAALGVIVERNEMPAPSGTTSFAMLELLEEVLKLRRVPRRAGPAT
jgi:hypothetical protein